MDRHHKLTHFYVAILCGQRRGDTAGPLFNDSLENDDQSHAIDRFTVIKETLTIILGFVGLPSVMPAIFGIIGELKKRSITSVHLQER